MATNDGFKVEMVTIISFTRQKKVSAWTWYKIEIYSRHGDSRWNWSLASTTANLLDWIFTAAMKTEPFRVQGGIAHLLFPSANSNTLTRRRIANGNQTALGPGLTLTGKEKNGNPAQGVQTCDCNFPSGLKKGTLKNVIPNLANITYRFWCQPPSAALQAACR